VRVTDLPSRPAITALPEETIVAVAGGRILDDVVEEQRHHGWIAGRGETGS
jgi:hypothetical protein